MVIVPSHISLAVQEEALQRGQWEPNGFKLWERVGQYMAGSIREVKLAI